MDFACIVPDHQSSNLFLKSKRALQRMIPSSFSSWFNTASDDDSCPHWWTTDIAPIPAQCTRTNICTKCNFKTVVFNHIFTINMCNAHCESAIIAHNYMYHQQYIGNCFKLGNDPSSVDLFQWRYMNHHWKYSQYIGGRYLVSLAQGTFRLTLKVQTLNRTVSPRVTTCHHNHVARQKIQTASTM